MKKMLVWFGLLVLSFLIMPQTRAQAGEINGNEASVISAAKGTFEYQGKIYVAQQSYIDQLSAKLSEDDVDMTADEAAEAIAGIYANVAEGVKEGYLVLKDGSSGGTQGTGDAAQTSAEPGSSGEPAGTDGEDGQNAQGGSTVSSGDNQNTSGDSQTASGEKIPSKGKFKLTMKDTLALVNVIEQSSAGEVAQVMQDHYFVPVRNMFSMILPVMALIMLVILIWKKRKNWKELLAAGLGMLLLSAGISIATIAVSIAYGFYTPRALVNQVSSEGYYKEVYTVFHQNMADTLEEAGFPEDILDDLFDEGTVYLDGKQALEAVFDSGKTMEFMDIQVQIKEKLTSYLTEENYSNVEELSDILGNLAGIIQNSYADSLKFTYVDWLEAEAEAGQKECTKYMAIGAVLCLLGLIITVLSQKHVYWVFRVLGWGFLVPAVATAGTAVWYFLTKPYGQLGLTQQYYSDFFSSYLQWNGQLLIAVAGLELLVFLICVAADFSFHKLQKKNPFSRGL